MIDQPQQNIIKADPTKEFFISMLVKDIPLIRAIIDLVDNSTDGARRLRRTENFEGLWVDIELGGEHFIISDNCGGIALDIARNYAFRFGRPPEAKEFISTEHSVGLFGVGMKRAIFKMGNYFKLESLTDDLCFIVEQDIVEWSEQEAWNFTFEKLPRKKSALKEPGTMLIIEDLHGTIKEQFWLENFVNELRNKLEAAHRINIEKGLKISVNGHELKAQEAQLLDSEEIQPGYSHPVFESHPNVDIRIYTGIFERGEPEKAGWYLYCNDRLVLYADKEIRTGWGDGRGFPQYHNDFAYFRGYVFFNSYDAEQLPWNTTKTGVDEDAPLYRATREEMKRMMRPVIRFLQSLSRDRSDFGEASELQQAIDRATAVGVTELPTEEQVFLAPKQPERLQPDVSSIQYKMPNERIDRVKEQLEVDTNKEVGEATFNYYYALECED